MLSSWSTNTKVLNTITTQSLIFSVCSEMTLEAVISACPACVQSVETPFITLSKRIGHFRTRKPPSATTSKITEMKVTVVMEGTIQEELVWSSFFRKDYCTLIQKTPYQDTICASLMLSILRAFLSGRIRVSPNLNEEFIFFYLSEFSVDIMRLLS